MKVKQALLVMLFGLFSATTMAKITFTNQSPESLPTVQTLEFSIPVGSFFGHSTLLAIPQVDSMTGELLNPVEFFLNPEMVPPFKSQLHANQGTIVKVIYDKSLVNLADFSSINAIINTFITNRAAWVKENKACFVDGNQVNGVITAAITDGQFSCVFQAD